MRGISRHVSQLRLRLGALSSPGCRLVLSSNRDLSALPPAPQQGPSPERTSLQHSPAVSPSDRGRVPASIWACKGARLHLQRGHPLHTVRAAIDAYISSRYPAEFSFLGDLHPVVPVTACFDDLLVPPGHPSRAPSDTYYLDDTRVLRAHMTAHTVALLRSGVPAFVAAGDVNPRATVDRTHYPVFHQADGARLMPGASKQAALADLRACVNGLAAALFGTDVQTRWVDASFPFTHPSLELEVLWGGEWLEVLGCGLLRQGVLERAGVADNGRMSGWAFGLGLERLAMILFGIPDIRLFWSKDARFLEQFVDGDLRTQFKAFSSYPAVFKDVSFWVGGQQYGRCAPFHDNDVHELAREIAGDLVERVECIDTFQKGGRTSHCFRITFRSMERSLTHVEVNELYHSLRSHMTDRLDVELR